MCVLSLTVRWTASRQCDGRAKNHSPALSLALSAAVARNESSATTESPVLAVTLQTFAVRDRFSVQQEMRERRIFIHGEPRQDPRSFEEQRAAKSKRNGTEDVEQADVYAPPQDPQEESVPSLVTRKIPKDEKSIFLFKVAR
ncbi:hypothetical protein TGARI_360550 [Toxoplasma gondii ARI]|uniref:Uncharacterized protein n=1 Tax=Toxoplasma gondii ARI TaxID=1074872 RepID=A0A139XNW2_TOXGO|nr:hypothetical protein TGARI_360550 [Toxoplasma gondii ARI]